MTRSQSCSTNEEEFMSKKIMYSYAAVAFICMILGNSVSPSCVESNQDQAVVKNLLHHQIWAFSDWIDVDSNYLHIKSAEFVHHLCEQVDYNFMMHPRGKILLPPLDEFPALNLYSAPKTSSVHQNKDLPYSLKGVLLFLLLDNVSGEENDFFVADYSMNNLPVWGKFSGPVDMGLLDNPDIDEASGIVATRQDTGFLWTHNE